MTVKSRLDSLKTKHATLDSRLFDEGTRPRPDQLLVKQIKVEKLRVKEEIGRLQRTP
ncbi:YdcH family protein [Rhizosaccharibacter radicis]|uniref:DUF465 domain-containing protein n=1 Tax=Rhizosaccharibacter radicis TaxID=2782605 RepID=A0ABT1VWT2_9PROT|nr:DUF465 domain-containing protein [Acetobacteraceae bacterium KSS12]